MKDRSLLVSAGAGSGKTTVLVERVAELIYMDATLNLDDFLIVTFTEAAAAEMRERIANRLRTARQAAEEQGQDAFAERLRDQEERIDRAQISTLHSFCLDVVRRNFFALKLEPGFSILSQEDNLLLKMDVLQQLLEQRLQNDAGGRFAQMLQRFQASTPERLRDLVFRVDEFARSQEHPEAWLKSVEAPFLQAAEGVLGGLQVTEAFLRWMERLIAMALADCQHAVNLAAKESELASYADNLRQAEAVIKEALVQLQTGLSAAVANDGLEQVLIQLEAALSLLKARGVRAKNSPLKEPVRKLRIQCANRVAEVAAVLGRGEQALLGDLAVLQPDVHTLLELVADFQAQLREEKQRRAGVDFSDLEHFALEAIETETTGECYRLRDRFRHVFVDEYQDTSPIQDAIISAVARADNLFLVGDVKQSIYRFRMAEPGLFLEKQARFRQHSGDVQADGQRDGQSDQPASDEPAGLEGLPAATGIALELAANYRSRWEIVSMVNFIFRHVFSFDFGGIDYSGDATMKFGAAYPSLVTQLDEKPDSKLQLETGGLSSAATQTGTGEQTKAANAASNVDVNGNLTSNGDVISSDSCDDQESGLSLAGPIELHLIERKQQASEADGATDADPSGRDASGGDASAGDPAETDTSVRNAFERDAFERDAYSEMDVDSTAAAGDAWGEEDDAKGSSVEEDAADLVRMEQEALVMAARIRELMGITGGKPRQVYDARAGAYRPLQYRDIVILLRSAKGRVNVILETLKRADIPSYGVTSTGFFAALETQWFLSALSVIDNPRRDVELAAFMRSPLVGFTDRELGLIRLAARGPLYAAVIAAAKEQGRLQPQDSDSAFVQAPLDASAKDEVEVSLKDTAAVQNAGTRQDAAAVQDAGTRQDTVALQDKVRTFLRQLRRWRKMARHRGAFEVLKDVVDTTGILYYLLGMPGGETRQANLEALLEQAKAFDGVSFDGAFGFVRRLQATVRSDLDVGEARTLGEQEDVVRVMTIHQSKGLEFPVVFIADMGKTFYQSPDERKFPLHRTYGFGPVFIDFTGGRRWKTLASIAVEEANLAGFLEEEARVLYVALTRAREQLILVGSQSRLTASLERWGQMAARAEEPFSRSALMGAKTYLDWLMPLFLRHPQAESLRSKLEQAGGIRLPVSETDAPLEVQLWNTSEAKGRALPTELMGPFLRQEGPSLSDEAARLGDTSHPRSEPTRFVARFGDFRDWEAWASHQDEALTTASTTASPAAWLNGRGSGSAIPGKVTATDLRRLWAQKFVSRQSSLRLGTPENLLDDPAVAASLTDKVEVSPRGRGVAFHEVMQHVDFRRPPNLDDVKAELEDLVDSGKISIDTFNQVSAEDVAAFKASELGRRLAKSNRIFREQGFFTKLPISEDSRGVPQERLRGSGRPDDFVVVQGVIDCLAEVDGRWVLIDYKTDRVTAEQAPRQAREYEAQVATYLQVVRQVVDQVVPRGNGQGDQPLGAGTEPGEHSIPGEAYQVVDDPAAKVGGIASHASSSASEHDGKIAGAAGSTSTDGIPASPDISDALESGTVEAYLYFVYPQTTIAMGDVDLQRIFVTQKTPNQTP